MKSTNPYFKLRQTAGCFALFLSSHLAASAQTPGPCSRRAPGSTIDEPGNLFSVNGVLNVNFTYRTEVDQFGNTLFCFVTDSGIQSPTLHVSPGDRLIINLTNALPETMSASAKAMPGMIMTGSASNVCGSGEMNSTSVNIHYHGANVAPVCHQDEAIKTVINAGDSFRYNVHFPLNEPPGLYWYHPHVHGISEAALLGGASGAIVVDGIQNVNPLVAGLPERTLIVRDNLVPGNPVAGGAVPSWDISLNYIPVPYPEFTPVVIPMKPGEKQFWRVLNGSADTILDLQVQYDGAPQLLKLVALDGVPTGSQDGTGKGRTIPTKHILLPPAGRAEFVVAGPAVTVKNAAFVTLNIQTGPYGDNDPQRTIAAIIPNPSAPEPPLHIPVASGTVPLERFVGLSTAAPAAVRKLYFSEVLSNPSDPNSPTNFFITVDGQTPVLFNPNNPPSIVTAQGSVEDWTIENRALENHEFHIHQIHFLLLEQNGKPAPAQQYLDTVQVPFWSGTGPYPSVKVRMDFRGPDVGDFVYHCHILGHEDSGMMAIIRVTPQ